jgi:DNA-binding transcriptional regulator YdaS (Cro superfamily)
MVLKRRRVAPCGILHASDRKQPIEDKTLLMLRRDRGRLTELAHKLGLRPQAVHQWRRVPIARVLEVEAITGINRKLLRPDFYYNKSRSIARSSIARNKGKKQKSQHRKHNGKLSYRAAR